MSVPTSAPDRAVKVPHLVMALLYAGVVAVWALVASGAVGPGQVAFLVPGVLVAAGTLGLVASGLGAGRRRARAAPGPPPRPEHRPEPPTDHSHPPTEQVRPEEPR